MERERVRMPTGFGSYLTPLGKRLLLVYGCIYVLELNEKCVPMVDSTFTGS
jgi:hypothetical protein